ncbi:MAG: hypothetical protein KF749_06075 [Bacteroidetes bacterium]|nr:hypothetical protein [Bacteroidota bacterium]MCW5894647.1 hypothetical protein [Bacteroidota bacterium]
MKLTKADVAKSGLVPGLRKLIGDWQPTEFDSELKYRDSLLAYIREAVPSDCSVEKEYRHTGTTTDICVKWSGMLFKGEAFIEVKRNLDKKPTLDRLIGQLEALQPGKRGILVVLVGRTDEAMLGRLKEKYRRYFDEFQFEQPLAIIVK